MLGLFLYNFRDPQIFLFSYSQVIFSTNAEIRSNSINRQLSLRKRILYRNKCVAFGIREPVIKALTESF